MILFFLFIFALLFLILGLVKPSLTIFWGNRQNKTRKKVIIFYGLSSFMLFILLIVSAPSDKGGGNEEKNTYATPKNTDTQALIAEAIMRENQKEPWERALQYNSLKDNEQLILFIESDPLTKKWLEIDGNTHPIQLEFDWLIEKFDYILNIYDELGYESYRKDSIEEALSQLKKEEKKYYDPYPKYESILLDAKLDLKNYLVGQVLSKQLHQTGIGISLADIKKISADFSITQSEEDLSLEREDDLLGIRVDKLCEDLKSFKNCIYLNIDSSGNIQEITLNIKQTDINPNDLWKEYSLDAINNYNNYPNHKIAEMIIDNIDDVTSTPINPFAIKILKLIDENIYLQVEKEMNDLNQTLKEELTVRTYANDNDRVNPYWGFWKKNLDSANYKMSLNYNTAMNRVVFVIASKKYVELKDIIRKLAFRVSPNDENEKENNTKLLKEIINIKNEFSIPAEEPNRTQAEKFPLEHYNGEWVGEHENSQLLFEYIDENKANITIIHNSSPPSERIASIELYDVTFSNDGKYEFQFDDDGWGTKGNGFIELLGEQISVTIEHTRPSEGNWSIFSGKQVYTRSNG